MSLNVLFTGSCRGGDTVKLCLRYAGLPVTNDPGFKVEVAPILRYHKELWYHVNRRLGDKVPSDVIQNKELLSAMQTAIDVSRPKS